MPLSFESKQFQVARQQYDINLDLSVDDIGDDVYAQDERASYVFRCLLHVISLHRDYKCNINSCCILRMALRHVKVNRASPSGKVAWRFFYRRKHYLTLKTLHARHKYLADKQIHVRQKSLCALIGHSLDVELAGVHTSLPHSNPHQYDHYRKHHVCLI